MRFIDLTGQEFDNLEVIEFAGYASNGNAKWKCKCKCGRFKDIASWQIINRATRSCGCLRDNALRAMRTTHRDGNSTEHRIWSNIMTRCYNPKCAAYRWYGGRGIEACDRWRGDSGYQNFLSDVGRRPGPEYTLDRINHNGNYEPSNVRWATVKQQARNRRSNRMIEHDGRCLSVAEWAEILGVRSGSLLQRINSGWSIERALTTPMRRDKRTTPKLPSA